MNVTVVAPPQTEGAPRLSFVKAPGQPPVIVADANQVWKAALICDCVRFGPTDMGAGQFKTGVVAFVTVNVLMQVVDVPQRLVAVKVTLTEPPHALGAAKALLLTVALQPPVTDAKASQALNLVLIWAWVWQIASVRSVGQFNTKFGAAMTENVFVMLTGVAEQLLVAVNVTSLLPPHAAGAPVLLLDNTTPQPPVVVAEASQVAYLASIVACVWQAASAWLTGAFKTKGELATVKVAWQVVVNGAQVPV